MYVELTDRVGYVPGGTNIGVIRIDDRRVLLVDTGLNDTTARKVLRAVRDELGSDVVCAIITHGHADHFGANAFVHKRTGCEFMAPDIEATIIANPVLQPALLYGGADPVDALRNRFLLAEAGPAPAPLEMGRQSIEGLDVDVVALPGHSPNQAGILVDDVFFCADVVFPDAAIEKYRIPYLYGLTDHLASLEKAAGIPARVVIPGHGPVLEGLQGAVDSNRAAIERALDAVRDATREPATTDDVCAEVFRTLDVPVSDAQGFYLLKPTIAAYLAHLERIGAVSLQVEDRQARWLRR